MVSFVIRNTGHHMMAALRSLARRRSSPCCAVSAGRVHIVGAGPGPPDLITIRAADLLRQADVIIYDELGGCEEAVSAHARPEAEQIYVGKRGGRSSITQPDIDKLLIKHAVAGKRVVRLKGGCPSVFARAQSEINALAAAGVPFDLVPGVSSALAAPLLAGFPLTHRELSRAFAVASAHSVGSDDNLDWGALARLDTLVLLMAGRTLGEVTQKLQIQGKDPGTPVAVVRAAGTPEQRVWLGSLASIAADTQGESLSPCIVVVGQVAGLAAL